MKDLIIKVEIMQGDSGFKIEQVYEAKDFSNITYKKMKNEIKGNLGDVILHKLFPINWEKKEMPKEEDVFKGLKIK